MKTILIVEDDSDLRRGLTLALEKEYRVLSAQTTREGMDHCKRGGIDLALLDIGLPDLSGLEFLREIRRTSHLPVVLLTARDQETDEVAGFLSGADDYITKPFSLAVLRARVEVRLRSAQGEGETLVRCGVFALDAMQHRFFRGGEEIILSATEFRLLSLLMNHAGQTLTKERIIGALWDDKGNFVDENALAVNISRLRAKIEDDPRRPQTIKTVYGIGYIWTKE